jgi:hypothetical protein
VAELILTDEEKAAPTYLDWDDAALGKLVKKMAAMLHDKYGQEAAFMTTGAHLILGSAVKCNAASAVTNIDGFTISGEDAGDWKITVERVRDPKEPKRKVTDCTGCDFDDVWPACPRTCDPAHSRKPRAKMLYPKLPKNAPEKGAVDTGQTA